MRLQYFAYSSLDANSAFKPSKQTKIIVFVKILMYLFSTRQPYVNLKNVYMMN